MITITEAKSSRPKPTYEFYCDTTSEISDLPVDVNPGSTCLCRNNGNAKVYIFGGDGEWHEM